MAPFSAERPARRRNRLIHQRLIRFGDLRDYGAVRRVDVRELFCAGDEAAVHVILQKLGAACHSFALLGVKIRSRCNDTTFDAGRLCKAVEKGMLKKILRDSS